MPNARTAARNVELSRRILVVATLVVALPLSWLGSLDHVAKEYVESGLKRALVTFAAARSANAVISVLQETTVAMSPAGVGVTSGVGQALDPLNDLVEAFSTLMLAACISLGMQRLLISIGGLPAVSVGLTVVLVAWAALSLGSRQWPRWLGRLVVLLLFVRFAVPLAALGSEWAFRVAMFDEYQNAQGQVDLASKAMLPAPDAHQGKPETWVERIKRWHSETKEDLGAKFQAIKAQAENAVRHIVTLMAVFIVQTIVLPLVFLWLSFRLFGAALSWQTFRMPAAQAAAAR